MYLKEPLYIHKVGVRLCTHDQPLYNHKVARGMAVVYMFFISEKFVRRSHLLVLCDIY